MNGRTVRRRMSVTTQVNDGSTRFRFGRTWLHFSLAVAAVLLSGCPAIWNASDLEVWVHDQAVDQGCQRETIELEEWYTETAEGNVWRGVCRNETGARKSFGINVDAVWKPSQ